MFQPTPGDFNPREVTFHARFDLRVTKVILESLIFTARERSCEKLMFLPSANEVCEGYVFTPVCHSVHSRVGGVVSQHASRPTPKGEVEGSGQGESSGPNPGGRLRGLAGGWVSRPTPRGVYPTMHRADTPLPQQMATAPGGTHPTGMHSCYTCL